MCTTSLRKGCDPLLEYSQKCSSWFHLQKIIAWLVRYKDNLLRASKGDRVPRETPKYFTLEEKRRAERELFKNVQRQAFPDKVNHPEKPLKKTSRLYKQDPILIDCLLCVDGRLRNAPVPAQSGNNYWIILLRENHVTSLIIDHYHRICSHSGKKHVLALICQKFWITKGSSAVKSVLSKCVSCRCRQAPLCSRRWPTSQTIV